MCRIPGRVEAVEPDTAEQQRAERPLHHGDASTPVAIMENGGDCGQATWRALTWRAGLVSPRPPHRTAQYHTVSHHTAPHRTAPHRTIPHRLIPPPSRPIPSHPPGQRLSGSEGSGSASDKGDDEAAGGASVDGAVPLGGGDAATGSRADSSGEGGATLTVRFDREVDPMLKVLTPKDK
jgi:hypothetical protein